MIAVCASLPIYVWFSPVGTSVVSRVASILGFFVPLIAFGLYLWRAELFEYWRLTAIELPKLYAPIFLQNGLVSAIITLLRYVFHVSFSEHARQTVFALVLLSAAAVWMFALLGRERRNPNLLFVALISALLFSSALHLNEIFRLATSVTVGLCLVFLVADKLSLATPLFTVLSIGLVIGTFGNDSGNYFLPSKAQVESATTDDHIALFNGQHWSGNVFEYYNWFADDMRLLESRSCGLRYFRNETRDAFLAILSPFRQYQLMPVGAGMHNVPVDDWSRRLRPDYNLAERLLAHDIVIFSSQSATASTDRALPEGYKIFDRKITPKSRFLPDGDITLILTPATCGSRDPA